MPYLNIRVGCDITEEQSDAIAAACCGVVAELTGKPAAYIMVGVETTRLLMGGSHDPAAMIDYRAIGGIDPEMNAALTQRFGAILEQHAGICPSRLYAIFSDVAAVDWGWNNRTFG